MDRNFMIIRIKQEFNSAPGQGLLLWSFWIEMDLRQRFKLKEEFDWILDKYIHNLF